MTKSTYWGPPMSESQYAVFHFDVKTMSMRDAQGQYLSSGNDSPLIFDNLQKAERYCEQTTTAAPALGCRIYDHAGQIVRSFFDTQLYSRHHGRPAAKRNVTIGTLCLLAGVGSVTLDAFFEWRLILGVLLGARFLWVGTVKMADGIAFLLDERPGR